VFDDFSTLSNEQLASLASRVNSLLLERILRKPDVPAPEPNHMTAPEITADEACMRLGKSRRWLFAHADLPFVRRISRKTIMCDPVQLREWMATNLR
jgi:hypothetical protein